MGREWGSAGGLDTRTYPQARVRAMPHRQYADREGSTPPHRDGWGKVELCSNQVALQLESEEGVNKQAGKRSGHASAEFVALLSIWRITPSQI